MQSKLSSSQIKLNSGQPGTSSVIRTRGVVSANGATTPVIYIDGVRVDNRTLGSGAAGEANSTGGASSSALTDLPVESIERIEVIKGSAAATLYGADAANGVIQIFTKRGTAGKPSFNFETTQGVSVGTQDFLKYDETADILFRPGWMQTYRMGVNGGNQAVTYNFSGSVTRDEGFRRGNADTRYGMRTGVSAKLNDQLDYSGSLGVSAQTFSRDLNANFGGPFGDLESNLLGELDQLSPEELADVEQEVLDRVDLFDDLTRTRRFNISQALNYRPIEGLLLSGTFGLDARSSRNRQIQTNAFDIASGGNGVGQGSIGVLERNFIGLTGTFNAQYKRAFGDFSLNSQIGFQFFNDRDERVFFSANDVVEGSLSINNAAEQTATDILNSVANWGYYANANLGFKDRYFFEAGVRIDQNSAFGDLVDPQIFPKFGVAYSLSSENFMSGLVSSGAINALKIRANYGEAGNFPPAFVNNATYVSTPFLGNIAYTQGAAGDPNLKPERSKTIEVGMDVALWNNRITADFSYYNTVTEDAIFNAPFAPSFGLGNQRRNLGEIENSGIELALNVTAIDNDTWNLQLNYSINTNTNEVTDNGGVAPFVAYGFTFLGVFVDQGQPVGFLRGNRAVLDENGAVEIQPNEVLGQVTPEGFGSFGLNLTYKNRLNLSISGDYQYGSSIVNVNEVLSYGFTPAGSELVDEAFVGQPFFNIANLFVESGDYVKIRNIGINYRIPTNNLFGGTVIDRASIGFNVTNPFNFVSGTIDPEVSGAAPTGAAGRQGVDLGGYNYATESAPRTFLATLKLSF